MQEDVRAWSEKRKEGMGGRERENRGCREGIWSTGGREGKRKNRRESEKEYSVMRKVTHNN